jgi:hypothetical protein
VEKFVAVVICVLLLLPVGAGASADGEPLLQRASELSGLGVRHAIPRLTLSARRYDAALRRAAARGYPQRLREVDAHLYTLLGLTTHADPSRLIPRQRIGAWYDADVRRLLLRAPRRPARARLINELVRALVDQNFGLRRMDGLRSRDRDAALAAEAVVEGTAALAAGIRAAPPRGTPFERFVQVEEASGPGPGRALVAKLRYLGGTRAVNTALRSFPQTTEQLLHIDKFLEREPALPVRVPSQVGVETLIGSETFGELDVRSLLRAHGIPSASAVAAGWGGGRLALYRSPAGEYTAALELRWDSVADADEWRDAVPRLVAASFGLTTSQDCPPLDWCWTGTGQIGAGVVGSRSVLTSGANAAALGAALLG